ncbi:MAG: hypothetical protein ACYCXY_07325 [Acidimicrobiales bacterium]
MRETGEMPLFDEVKVHANQLAQEAQETSKAGWVRLADAEARRRAEVMLRDLGAADYVERSGQDTDATTANLERLVAELSDFETEHVALEAAGESGAGDDVIPSPPEPPVKGNVTLDS